MVTHDSNSKFYTSIQTDNLSLTPSNPGVRVAEDAAALSNPRSQMRGERDQLDNFLSDYVNTGAKPALPSSFGYMRPVRSGGGGGGY